MKSSWPIYSLGDIGSTRSGLSGKSKKDFGQGEPYIPYKNVFANTFVDLENVETVKINEGEKQTRLRKGDILFTTSSETPEEVGMSSVVLTEPSKPVYLNSFCFVYRLNDSSIIDENFAGYMFRNRDFRIAMKRNAKGTTRFNLSKTDFLSQQISLPDLDTQKKIAAIIHDVDESIILTQGSIDHTKKLRNGLFSNLFTNGIKKSKVIETELGYLPEHWEVIELDRVAKRGSGHTPSKNNSSYYNGGIKWISLADTKKFDLGLISNTVKNISELGIQNSSAVLHPSGSVVLSRDAGVGKSAVLGDDMAVSQHFMVWQCGPKLNNWYVYYYLQYKKPEFERIAVGSTIKTIGLQYFKSLKIPVPPLEEQEMIAQTLSALDEKIAVNKKCKLLQQELKESSMHDLFAGKVTV
jgi:type I restriction enzyme S subunit